MGGWGSQGEQPTLLSPASPGAVEHKGGVPTWWPKLIDSSLSCEVSDNKISPSSTGHPGSIPGRELRCHLPLGQKSQNIKEKQCCDKVNTDSKNSPHQKNLHKKDKEPRVGLVDEQFSHSAVSTLYDPMDCSTPGFPVHHHLPEPAQTHVHRVGDAIQPSHPQLPPSPSALNLSQHRGLFQ